VEPRPGNDHRQLAGAVADVLDPQVEELVLAEPIVEVQ
jgi:hypothetical protein